MITYGILRRKCVFKFPATRVQGNYMGAFCGTHSEGDYLVTTGDNVTNCVVACVAATSTIRVLPASCAYKDGS